jgi:aspartyl-tRNA(Asn)/glutamyl-tRNA(Gln) amidotransferase subunit A
LKEEPVTDATAIGERPNALNGLLAQARPPSDFDFGNIAGLAESLRKKRTSPVDAATTCLQRIERLQPQLNAFITIAAESATEDAKAAEREIAQGGWKGFLHGIPIGVKDFFDTIGIPTTAAFEHFKHRIPARDAAPVSKLRDAGAIIIGKTNMHTLGMGTTGLESCFGSVKNPWNPDFIAGGSSSGSAAAVASGMCWATLDTDAIGSCRLPAACCGVVGFKGTYALIDTTGILAGEQPPGDDILWLSHAGITTRNIEDTAVVLDALVDRRGGRDLGSFVDSLNQEADLRIGVANNARTDREVLEAFEQAVETIRGLGYPIKAAAAPLTDFSKGIADIERDRSTVADRCFEGIDLLLLPTTPTVTPRVSEATGNPLALSPENTMFANYYGLPAVSVPCGFDKRGLPLGLQIVGRPWDERSVLRLAYQYQMGSGRNKRPPLA